VGSPPWNRSKFVSIYHGLQKGEHVTQLISRPSRNTFGAVCVVQAAEALVGAVAHPHSVKCKATGYT
jgi:hypothetical protein